MPKQRLKTRSEGFHLRFAVLWTLRGSAIHYVALTGDEAAAQALEAAGWSMTLETSSGLTPFDLALDHQHFNFCDHALTCGADPEARTQGYSGLDHAAMQDSLKVADYLLKVGVDINGQKGVRPPICWAVQENSHRVFEVLLNAGANANRSAGPFLDDMTAVHLASNDDRLWFLDKLLFKPDTVSREVAAAARDLAFEYQETRAVQAWDNWLDRALGPPTRNSFQGCSSQALGRRC